MGAFLPNRRQIVFGTGAVALCEIARQSPARADWESISPQEAGFDPDLEARLDEAIRAGRAQNLHGVVVVRDGRLVVERYYEGADEIGFGPPRQVTFGPDVLHDLRSVTKSIVGLLYGIALDEGKVPAPDQPLLAQFPEYSDLAADTRRTRWSIAHALTMTLGIEWNENISNRDPSNSETAMDAAADRYRYVLERPIAAEPGQRWNYCGGATALIGRLIAKGTGQTLPEYAHAVLFDRLGIDAFEWRKARDGEPRAASGLRMKPRDLARIGQLLLIGGSWAGRSIVASPWLDASFTPRATAARERTGTRYGYHWYIGEINVGGAPALRSERWIGAQGNGGQRLYLLPGLKLAVAITAGNYNLPGRGEPSLIVLRDIILPSIKSG